MRLRALGERKCERRLDFPLVAAAEVDVDGGSAVLLLDECVVETAVDDAHDLHEVGHEDAGELAVDLRGDELVGEGGDGVVGVDQRAQQTAEEDGLQLDVVFLKMREWEREDENKLADDGERVDANDDVRVEDAIRNDGDVPLDQRGVSS